MVAPFPACMMKQKLGSQRYGSNSLNDIQRISFPYLTAGSMRYTQQRNIQDELRLIRSSQGRFDAFLE